MKNSKNNNIILGFSFLFYVFGFSLSNGFDIRQEFGFNVVAFGIRNEFCLGRFLRRRKCLAF